MNPCQYVSNNAVYLQPCTVLWLNKFSLLHFLWCFLCYCNYYKALVTMVSVLYTSSTVLSKILSLSCVLGRNQYAVIWDQDNTETYLNFSRDRNQTKTFDFGFESKAGDIYQDLAYKWTVCVSMLPGWSVQFTHYFLTTWTNITKVPGFVMNSLITAFFNNQT